MFERLLPDMVNYVLSLAPAARRGARLQAVACIAPAISWFVLIIHLQPSGLLLLLRLCYLTWGAKAVWRHVRCDVRVPAACEGRVGLSNPVR
jgi:hypothetical protein